VLPAWPVLQRAPRGDGHAVVVFPGLSASDASTAPLRKYLSGLGYLPYGWDQGFNFGPRAGVLEAAKSQVRHLFAQTGQRVSLVGWSLGGVYAREIAKALPDMARCVVSLGTPFAGGPKSTNAWRIYELTSGRAAEREAENYELNAPPLCPTTSIYSRTDGIVAWQASVQDNDARNTQLENIEVVASHVGLGLNPSTWWAVADRLSQIQGNWNPFKRPSMLGLQGLFYPNPLRN
jgi:pimeloyl-ACP methyl ester carboxylesterase